MPATAAASFSNGTDACGAASANCDPASSLFFDGIHPTAAGHALIGSAMLITAVPEPETYAMLLLGLTALAAVARGRSARPPAALTACP